MTTHIFLALGMWDEVAKQNEIASGPHRDHWGPGHGTHWLTYAYVQQGRYETTRQLLGSLAANAGSPPSRDNRGQLANFRARYVLDSEQWDGPEAKALAADTGMAGEDDYEYATFAAGYAAARRDDVRMAERMLARLTRVNGRATTTVRPGQTGNKVVPVILELSLRAELLRRKGGKEAAIALLRRATALEDGMPAEFGPPAVVKPSHELLGSVLLETGRASAAVTEFQRALALAPGRSPALLGLGGPHGPRNRNQFLPEPTPPSPPTGTPPTPGSRRSRKSGPGPTSARRNDGLRPRLRRCPRQGTFTSPVSPQTPHAVLLDNGGFSASLRHMLLRSRPRRLHQSKRATGHGRVVRRAGRHLPGAGSARCSGPYRARGCRRQVDYPRNARNRGQYDSDLRDGRG